MLKSHWFYCSWMLDKVKILRCHGVIKYATQCFTYLVLLTFFYLLYLVEFPLLWGWKFCTYLKFTWLSSFLENKSFRICLSVFIGNTFDSIIAVSYFTISYCAWSMDSLTYVFMPLIGAWCTMYFTQKLLTFLFLQAPWQRG